MKKFLIAGVATAAIVGLAPAIAQTAQKAPHTESQRHAKVHTRADVEAKIARRFARVDTDRDGFVTRAEADAAMQAMHAKLQQRMAQRPGGGAKARAKHRMGGRMFEMADANNDGRVSLPEAQAAALRHFDMVDTNRDGQITPEERRQMRHHMRHERHPG